MEMCCAVMSSGGSVVSISGAELRLLRHRVPKKGLRRRRKATTSSEMRCRAISYAAYW
jgi:hypothetical protein